jgi:hypothetical protein
MDGAAGEGKEKRRVAGEEDGDGKERIHRGREMELLHMPLLEE